MKMKTIIADATAKLRFSLKILNEIETFGEAKAVYDDSPSGSELKKKAEARMRELKPAIAKLILGGYK